MKDRTPPLESEPLQAAGQWHDLGAEEEIPAVGGLFRRCGRRSLALFRDEQGVVRAIDDICPHAGASLAGGVVEDGCVVCPWHAWMFDLHTGQCPDHPAITVDSFPVRVVDGRIQVRLSI